MHVSSKSKFRSYTEVRNRLLHRFCCLQISYNENFAFVRERKVLCLAFFIEKCGELWRIAYFCSSKALYRLQMRFIGTIEAKVDQKGRVFLPAQFRRILQTGNEERLILRKDLYEACLVIYPETVWNRRLDELHARLSVWNKAEQRLFRQFVKDVEWLSLDGNGRFLIPKRYLKMASIVQNVTFIGMDETIEVWAKEKNDSEAENVNLETEMERIMVSGI